jgi:hypothetical protein
MCPQWPANRPDRGFWQCLAGLFEATRRQATLAARAGQPRPVLVSVSDTALGLLMDVGVQARVKASSHDHARSPL